MPVDIVDLDSGLGCLITGSGNVTDHEYVSTLQKHLSQSSEKIQNYKYTLTDFGEVEGLDVSAKSISDIANKCTDIATILPDTLVALIAKDDLAYGLSRMWQMMAAGTTWEIMVFRDKEKAKYWIGHRVKQKFGISDLTFAE